MVQATTTASRGTAPSGSGASNQMVAPARTTASRGTAMALSWNHRIAGHGHGANMDRKQNGGGDQGIRGVQLAADRSRRHGRATLAASLWTPSWKRPYGLVAAPRHRIGGAAVVSRRTTASRGAAPSWACGATPPHRGLASDKLSGPSHANMTRDRTIAFLDDPDAADVLDVAGPRRYRG